MKLDVNTAVELVEYATKEGGKNGVRFGQMLWNIMPLEVTDVHTGTDNDFFYWKDRERILSVFYEHYVQQ